MRVEHEGGAAAWLAGTLPAPTMHAGTRTASVTGVTVLSESFFVSLVAGYQKVSLATLSL